MSSLSQCWKSEKNILDQSQISNRLFSEPWLTISRKSIVHNNDNIVIRRTNNKSTKVKTLPPLVEATLEKVKQNCTIINTFQTAKLIKA